MNECDQTRPESRSYARNYFVKKWARDGICFILATICQNKFYQRRGAKTEALWKEKVREIVSLRDWNWNNSQEKCHLISENFEDLVDFCVIVSVLTWDPCQEGRDVSEKYKISRLFGSTFSWPVKIWQKTRRKF